MDSLLKPVRAITQEKVKDPLQKFKQFQSDFDHWVHSSRQKIIGLPKDHFIVSGLTDAFNQLYTLYNIIGVFPGEYGYHKLALDQRITYDLESADCIVISHPFSADGMNSHDKLAIADKLNKPIFVDCAFFGACTNIDFDFSMYKNIHSVCFSLSKTFGTGLNRVGLLYTIDKFPVTVYDRSNYPLITTAIYHHKLISERTPDYIADMYRAQQIQICKKLDITPSNTIMLGIDQSDVYKSFKYYDSDINRICISNLFNV